MLRISFRFLQSLLMWLNLRAPISDAECVSCGSLELTVDGPGAYTCRSCGYVGGSQRQGVATLEERRARFASQSTAQRERSAYADLDNARLFLRSSLGTFEVATDASWRDLADLDMLGDGADDEKHRALSEAFGEVARAREHLLDAAARLSLAEPGRAPAVLAEEIVLWTVDTDSDLLLVDAAMHVRVRAATGQARKMLAGVERVLAERFPDGRPGGVAAPRPVERPAPCARCQRVVESSTLTFDDTGVELCSDCLEAGQQAAPPSSMVDHKPFLVVIGVALALGAWRAWEVTRFVASPRKGPPWSLLGIVAGLVAGLVALRALWRVWRDSSHRVTRDHAGGTQRLVYLMVYAGCVAISAMVVWRCWPS